MNVIKKSEQLSSFATRLISYPEHALYGTVDTTSGEGGYKVAITLHPKVLESWAGDAETIAAMALLLVGRRYADTEAFTVGRAVQVGGQPGAIPLTIHPIGGNVTLEQLAAMVREGSFGAIEATDLHPVNDFDLIVVSNDQESSIARKCLICCSVSAPQKGGAAQLVLHSERVSQRFVGNFGEHIDRALQFLSSQPHTSVGAFELVSAAERDLICGQFNKVDGSSAMGATLLKLVEAAAQAAPDHPALVHHDGTVTYRQLLQRAGTIAARLQAVGVASGDRVVCRVARGTPEMVLSAVAAMWLGAAYVPIANDVPASRRDQLVESADASAVLTTVLEHGAAVPVVEINLRGSENVDAPPMWEGSGEETAYLMFTSGTTGEPKPVVISHRAAASRVVGCNYAALGRETRLLQTGAVGFDATTFEQWGALGNGGTLVLIPTDDLLDAASLRIAMDRYNVNLLFVTTALFNLLTDQDPGIFGRSHVLVGGEVASISHMQAALEATPDMRLSVVYGPTENTTFSTSMPLASMPGWVPIGKPIQNSTGFVVSVDGKMQPPGVPGELYVGGDGLADGYYGLIQATSDSFVYPTFAQGVRLYKTGDIAVCSDEGVLFFVGRRDSQIKVRGHRIEPAEIEGHLLSYSGVKAACVIKQSSDGIDGLVAYVAAAPDIRSDDLREWLRDEVPGYMVPDSWVIVDELPLNANSKLDRAALPKLVSRDGPRRPVDVDWADDLERQIGSIFSGVLGMVPVGRNDNFFQLGGHSLLATRLWSRLRDRVDAQLQLSELVAQPTPAAVAQLARSRSAGAKSPRPVLRPRAQSETGA